MVAVSTASEMQAYNTVKVDKRKVAIIKKHKHSAHMIYNKYN